MLLNVLLVAHIVVLGYWLGSEFVINSGYRHVCHASTMPFEERNRLMDHVLDVDQHVRYALVLQIGLGLVLASLIGYVPGGGTMAAAAGLTALIWLGFVEWVHRARATATGATLARIDRAIRYVVMVSLAVAGGAGALSIVMLPESVNFKALEIMASVRSIMLS